MMMIVILKMAVLTIVECILTRESLASNGTVQTGASHNSKVMLVLFLKLDIIVMNPLKI
uniref:Uncharacterized protein n=1 Tax=Amphimedon queenslandica TaxID=400682 RepID=A0A1X7VCV7_AMPQE